MPAAVDSGAPVVGPRHEPLRAPLEFWSILAGLAVGFLAIELVLADSTWRCGLADYVCKNAGPVPARVDERRTVPWSAGPGQLWRIDGLPLLRSPDGKLEAFVHNYNAALRSVGSAGFTLLSHDGTEGNRYARASIGSHFRSRSPT